MAAQLVSDKALGADLLEVGYRQRAGVTLERHVAAWDVCSRNGVFLTGTGMSDSHGQDPWNQQLNRFLTWAWAASAVESDLLAALRAGRVYTGDMGLFAGSLDLLLDGCCPMGSVSVSTQDFRSLRVTAAYQLAAACACFVGSSTTQGPLNRHPTPLRMPPGRPRLSRAGASH